MHGSDNSRYWAYRIQDNINSTKENQSSCDTSTTPGRTRSNSTFLAVDEKHMPEYFSGNEKTHIPATAASMQELSSVSDRKQAHQSLLVPTIAFITANYNFTVLASLMVIMEMDVDFKNVITKHALVSTLKMLSYAGAVVGQFCMGYAGDCFGRRNAMLLTLSLIIFGALSSALCCWGSALMILSIMCGFRFILGVGNGGVYPMSAVAAAEGTNSSKTDDRNRRVAFVYFGSPLGTMAPYLLALILYYCTSNPEIIWRVLLGVGALPIFCIIWDTFRMKDSEEYVVAKQSHKLWKAFRNREYWLDLLGTGGCWFLYDVASYGILLIQPDITARIFGSANGVSEQLWQGTILSIIGMPGALAGILVVRQMGCKWLQFWGFMAIAFSASLTGIVGAVWPNVPWAQMGCLIFVNFTLNWGAAVSTFVLPAEIYPPECRSTYHGISAAMGKLGAVVGIYSFQAILHKFGVAPLMASAALVAVSGSILTWFFIGTPPKTWKAGVQQCFGSLLRSIPFVDLRQIR